MKKNLVKLKIIEYMLIHETKESKFIFRIDIDQQKFINEFTYSGNPVLDCIILNFNDKNLGYVINQLDYIYSSRLNDFINNSYFPEKTEFTKVIETSKSVNSNPQLKKFLQIKHWVSLIYNYHLDFISYNLTPIYFFSSNIRLFLKAFILSFCLINVAVLVKVDTVEMR